MVGSIASGSGTSVCTVFGHRSGADKNALRSFSRRRSGEAVRRKLGEAQSPRQKRRAIIWVRNSPRHHRPHRRGDEPPAASATSGDRITLGHNLRIHGHNAGPGPHVPRARGVEPFSRSPQPSARPRHRAPGRGGVDRTTPRPSSVPATKKTLQEDLPEGDTHIHVGDVSRKSLVVELRGFEPLTFSLRTRRATNCAIAPRTRTA